MSLSDCPKCWDTPCECGHMGYLIVRLRDDFMKRFNGMSERNQEEFMRRLKVTAEGLFIDFWWGEQQDA